MLTLTNFYGIFLDIVKSWPIEAGANRLNTFSILEDGADREQPTLGRTYEDFLAGAYWSRSWDHGGRDKSKLKRDNGILMIELKRGRYYPGSSEASLTKELYPILSLYLAPGGRTSHELDLALMDLADQVIQEALKYQKFSYSKDGEPGVAWMTTEKAQYLATQPGWAGLAETNRGLFDYLDFEGSELQKWGPSSENIRGVYIRPVLRGCMSSRATLDYSQAGDDLQFLKVG
jgi:hypothetical protein